MSGKNAYYLGFQIQPSANKYGLPSVLWLVVTLGEEGTLIGSRGQKELLPRVVFFYLFMYLSFWLFFVFVISFGFVGADSGRGWGH